MSRYVMQGIDVSGYQGNIDWSKVAKAGIKFAMLKATEGNTITDSRFYTNVEGAQAAGIPVGAYHFFAASNRDEMIAECNYFLDTVKGIKLGMPLALDVEGKILDIGKSVIVPLLQEFCERVEKAGYYVAIYASASVLKTTLNDERLKPYDLWAAQWSSSEPNIPQSYGMWQYSNQGNVLGISGRVDLDYSFYNYPSIMARHGLNNYPSTTRTHVVQPGESFWAIARVEMGSGTLYKQLAEYNGMEVTDVIHPGDVLKIPG